MQTTIGRAWVCFVLGALGLAACGDDPPKTGNGVNDVLKACEIRTTWVRDGQNECSVCESAVVSPRCECVELRDFSAACIEQADKRKGVCTVEIDNCVNSCARNDCNCVETCYANAVACKAASAARDGCIADACAAHCK